MANDKPSAQWRNFAAWSAAGAVSYVIAVWGVSALLHQDVMGAMLGSPQVAAKLGLALIFAMACVGFSSWKRPFNRRTVRNFAIASAVAVILCVLVIRGFGAFARAGAIGGSEWVAAVAGSTLVVMGCLGTLTLASAHTGADFIADEVAAEEMRERGRLFLYSYVWTAACGLLLIALGLAGHGGVVSPAAALAGALVLIAILTVLGVAVWRLSDELGRTLSYEAGNMAFYLILVVGGGWAMLAHLGFVAGPAPLDWLTLFTVLLFVASFIAVGRRRLLTR
ncbi:MAG: hypothetical protein WC729_05120 [Sphingomonas sp.]|uniref:hypothetical protein n=1 Tax=Sphingomonas sp. TaxID=28214 RepID=UPI0035671F08